MNTGLVRQSDSFDHKLTLISAPAGFGKTTLLSEWIAQCLYPVAWISLDQRDNDPAHFWAYFAAALQRVHVDVADVVQAMFQSPQVPPADTILTPLLNQIAAASNVFVLVLDDYHVIETQAVHEGLALLLDHQPPQMHLVIATRVDPPLPIARLRGRSQLTEIYQADLRFTSEEASDFLNQVMGLNLSSEYVSALERRTEGWITGLQMAAISMQGRNDLAGFVETFTGSHRYILDYLREEVLCQQPQEVRTFLLQTSILDRLSGALCDAVRFGANTMPSNSGETQDSSQAILEHLERSNLFVIPLDDERRWYRYHHLFADLLRQSLQREQSDLVPTLHRRASEWYQAKELYPDAVSHSLAAGDEERAAELIGREGWDMLVRGEMRELLGWLDSLPQELVNSRPQLGVLRAWALALTGRWDDVEQSLMQIGEGDMPGEMAALQAYIASVQGDVPRTIALCKQASEALPERKWFSRSFVALSLGIAYFADRQVQAARKALSEAVELFQKAGLSYMVQAAMMELGLVQQMAGSLHEADQTFRTALNLAPGQDIRPVPITGMAYLGLARAQYEWNNLDHALQNVKKGIEVTDLGGFTIVLLHNYVQLIEVYMARGDMMAALQTFEKAERLAQQRHYPDISSLLVSLQVRFWLMQGDLTAASQWLQEHRSSAGDVPEFAQEPEQIAAAKVLLALNQPASALVLLRRLQSLAEETGRIWRLIEILLLQALALQVEENWDQAVFTLGRALSLAEPEGYVRTFLDKGEPLARLLRRALSAGIAPNYVARLLATFGEEASSLSPAMDALVEPLTEREIDVLRLIVAGLSNAEIAEELFVAVSTVKSHVNHIYGKLGVGNRIQAAEHARSLGLV
ncbi:MAG: LuxR C-terminal-related transcriptional regulator [Anaerolineae bacterium]